MKHRRDPLPRSYRRLKQDGERRTWLRYVKPTTRLARAFFDADPEFPPVVTTDTQTLHAEPKGATMPVGPMQMVSQLVAYGLADRVLASAAMEDLTHLLAERLAEDNCVVDQDDEIEWIWSVQVYATARATGWPDEVPGLTSIPWREIEGGHMRLPLRCDIDTLNSIVLPRLLDLVRRAEYFGAWKVAVLAEPLTASRARIFNIDEYVTIVEDARQKRGVLQVAEGI